MANKIYYSPTALTGGAANSLDYIDGALLADGDIANVMISGTLYIYRLNATAGTSESSPDRIVPDTNPGTKVWELQTVYGANILPRSYLAGLTLFNDTDTAHDIGINVGTCRDSANAYNLTLSAILTKRIDASWAAGDDAGGMFTGSVGNTTWYHVFLIRKDEDGSIDAGYDTSVTAANRPAGYTAYRRLGSVLTDGSANILQFFQDGDYFGWVNVLLDYEGSNPGTSAQTVTLAYVPTGVTVEANLNATINNISNDNISCYISHMSSADVAPSTTATPLSMMPLYTLRQNAAVRIRTNTSAQFRYRWSASGANDMMRFATLGYTDRRGRDD